MDLGSAVMVVPGDGDLRWPALVFCLDYEDIVGRSNSGDGNGTVWGQGGPEGWQHGGKCDGSVIVLQAARRLT